MIDRIINHAVRALELILGLALLAAVILNVANVISRYLLLRALPGADEILVFVLIWLVFLGLAVSCWRDDHLRMDLLTSALPAVWRRRLGILQGVVLIALLALVITQSWTFVDRIARIGQVSMGAEIPMSVPHAAIPLGLGLGLCLALLRLLRMLPDGDEEPRTESDPGP